MEKNSLTKDKSKSQTSEKTLAQVAYETPVPNPAVKRELDGCGDSRVNPGES